jgi:hypothetical protein
VALEEWSQSLGLRLPNLTLSPISRTRRVRQGKPLFPAMLLDSLESAAPLAQSERGIWVA